MKKIFVFALMAIAILLAAAVIPQVQAVNWETYKDPNGKYSIDYPTSWGKHYGVVWGGIEDGVGFYQPPVEGEISLSVVTTGESEPGKAGKIEVATEGENMVILFAFGEKYAVRVICTSPNFDSVYRDYFEPMINSIKVK